MQPLTFWNSTKQQLLQASLAGALTVHRQLDGDASGDLQHSLTAVCFRGLWSGTFDWEAGASEASLWLPEQFIERSGQWLPEQFGAFFHLIMGRRRLCLNHRAR
jgi:hypothetical protein